MCLKIIRKGLVLLHIVVTNWVKSLDLNKLLQMAFPLIMLFITVIIHLWFNLTNTGIFKWSCNLPYCQYVPKKCTFSYSLKYVDGYFYISAKAYFHKTNKNFIRIASYFNYDHHPASSYYTSIYYDSSSSLFYVAGLQNQGVSIFDTNSNLHLEVLLHIPHWGILMVIYMPVMETLL